MYSTCRRADRKTSEAHKCDQVNWMDGRMDRQADGRIDKQTEDVMEIMIYNGSIGSHSTIGQFNRCLLACVRACVCVMLCQQMVWIIVVSYGMLCGAIAWQYRHSTMPVRLCVRRCGTLRCPYGTLCVRSCGTVRCRYSTVWYAVRVEASCRQVIIVSHPPTYPPSHPPTSPTHPPTHPPRNRCVPHAAAPAWSWLAPTPARTCP